MTAYRASNFSRSLRRRQQLDGDLRLTARDLPFCSVRNAVRNYDTSLVTGPELMKLQKMDYPQPSAQSFVNQSLIQIRKRHDRERMRVKQKQQQLQIKKDQLVQLKIKQLQLQQKLDSQLADQSLLHKNHQEIANTLEQFQMEANVYKHMRARTKFDILVLRNRLNGLNSSHRNIHNSYVQTRDQHRVASESLTRAERLSKEISGFFQQKKQTIDFMITNKENALKGERDIIMAESQRNQYLTELADKVGLQKDVNEAKTVRLKLTHVFLSCLLKEKMQREMSRFSLIQNAFKDIKLTTGVTDTSQLVKKFINKEADYGELLFKISQNEQKINQLRAQHSALYKKGKELKGQITFYQQTLYTGEHLQNANKDLLQLDQSQKALQVTMHKYGLWLNSTLSRLGLINGNIYQSADNQAQKSKKLFVALRRLVEDHAQDQPQPEEIRRIQSRRINNDSEDDDD